MTSLSDVLHTVEHLWPISGAEAWDSAGLVSGDPAAEVSRILLAVDAVGDTVDEALESGAGLLLVHHPLLLRGVTTVAETTAKGALIARLIRGRCALLAAHTNADVVATGTSARLAELLALTDARPIVETAPGIGLGRVGRLPEPMTLGLTGLGLLGLVSLRRRSRRHWTSSPCRGRSRARHCQTEFGTLANRFKWVRR